MLDGAHEGNSTRLFPGDDSILDSPRSRFRTAIILAIAAGAVQIVIFPLFAEGALSPLDDILDGGGVAVALFRLLGWHWEFLPSLLAELVPGVDLVPFWTLAVANVYRKWKQIEPDTNSGTPNILEIPLLERETPVCIS